MIRKLVLISSITLVAALAGFGQNIVFTSLDGSKIDVEAQKDKVVVMAIGASWLPLSNDQAETINKLAKRYEGEDIVSREILADIL